MKTLLALAAGTLLASCLTGCSRQPAGTSGASETSISEPAGFRPLLSTYEDLANTRFGPAPDGPGKPPHLAQVPIPKLPGAYAIWGATGRDTRGHIWIGVSAYGSKPPSAQLLEYLPEQGEMVVRGDAVSELKRAGVYREGEGQMKIHSKIIQAADGHLYFTSADEEGESEDGRKLPIWGSHLWRLRLPEYRWEHLMAAPEGLIAVSGMGKYIYALGYFGHMLYQFDCETGEIRSLRVGAIGGHISRNLLSDDRGHVYVPRLTYKGAAELAASLVEFNPMLEEVAETPIQHYVEGSAVDSHGIVGFQYLADRSIVFVTHMGYLYRVTPRTGGPADVAGLGWFHPRGEAYVASLFTLDGVRYLTGASKREDRYEWLVYDLSARASVARPLRLPETENHPLQDLAVYGSLTRDDLGSFYLAGTYSITPSKSAPVLMQVRLGH